MLKTKTMNIRVLDQTLEQAEKLQKVLKAPSKSDVIRRTIDLTDLIVEALEKLSLIHI